MKTTVKATYNGWKNRQTWNAALWINNDEPLYRAAVSFMQSYKGRTPYRDFIADCGMTYTMTPDRICWISSRISYSDMNALMREFAA